VSDNIEHRGEYTIGHYSRRGIKEITRELLPEHEVFEELDLSHNEIKEIPEWLFRLEYSGNLRVLNLSNNQIDRLEHYSADYIAKEWPSRKGEGVVINLSHNKIKRLPINFFDNKKRMSIEIRNEDPKELKPGKIELLLYVKGNDFPVVENCLILNNKYYLESNEIKRLIDKAGEELKNYLHGKESLKKAIAWIRYCEKLPLLIASKLKERGREQAQVLAKEIRKPDLINDLQDPVIKKRFMDLKEGLKSLINNKGF